MRELKRQDLCYFYENRILLYKAGLDALNIWRLDDYFVVQYCNSGDTLFEYYTDDLKEAFQFIEDRVNEILAKNLKTKNDKCRKILADIDLFKRTGEIRNDTE